MLAPANFARKGPLKTVVFAVAFLWQLLILTRFSQSGHFLPVSDDMHFYHEWALRILSGEWTDHRAFYGLPGYAFILALIYKVCGVNPFAVGLLQAFVFAATASVVYAIGVEIGRLEILKRRSPEWIPEVLGGIAALGWTFFVPAQAFSVILMPTVWSTCFYWSVVLFLLKIEKPPRVLWWFLLGTLTGMVATLVATVLFAVPLALARILSLVWGETGTPDRIRRAAAAAVLLLLGVVAGTAPVWIHNYFIAREPVFLSAHSGINLWIGNNPVANGYPKIPPGLHASQEGLLRDSVTLAQRATGSPLKRFEVSRYWQQKANDWISSNRPEWRRLMWRKFENFWNAYQYDDLTTIRLMETARVLWPGIHFGIVSVFGILGIVFGIRNRAMRWVSAAIFLHLAALAPVFVTERYRMAAVPGLLLGGALILTVIWILILERKWLTFAGIVLLLAGSTMFVTIGRGDPGNWSLDHYKAGIRSLDLGDLATADAELKTAFAYAPESAEINFALGNLAFTEKDMPQAKTFYRRAIDRDATHAGAFNNLGFVMLEEGRWDWAEKLLRRAIALEPENARTHFLLARTLQGAGRTEEAHAAAQRAVLLNPKQPEFNGLEEKLRSGAPQ